MQNDKNLQTHEKEIIQKSMKDNKNCQNQNKKNESININMPTNSDNKNEINKKEEENKVSFTCFYEINDYNETQIINNKSNDLINKEIETKIKIIEGDNTKNIVFKKKI